jgi:hypothetical protein
MVRSQRPAARSTPVAYAGETIAAPASPSLPIIVNVGAALQALAGFFERHTLLPKGAFVHLLRNSAGVLAIP